MKTVIDDILKKYGDGVLVGGSTIIDENNLTIPVSPSINISLNGGIPEGTWTILSSKPKWGKTTLALFFASVAQREEYGSREVFYLDIEGRLKKLNLQGIAGLNLEKFHAIRSTEEKILSAQDFLSIGEDILKSMKRCVLIVDSYSALCHEKELLEGVGTSTRGAGGYTLLAGFCRQMSQVVPVMKSNVIGIVQMMANVTGYGAPMVEKGGTSIMYQADVWLRAKSMKPWIVAEKQIGQITTWHCVTSALGAPGAEVENYIRYGIGIDVVRELIDLGCAIGLIDKPERGAWYTCKFMQDHLALLNASEWNDNTAKQCKFQGEAKLYKHLQDNPAWMKALERDLNKVLKG